MPRLLIADGEGKGSVFHLEDTVTLGRSSHNPIHLSGTQISRVHARIEKKGDKFVIKDTGSANGVQVNDAVIHEKVLQQGDRIRLGSVLLVFEPDYRIVSSSRSEEEASQAAGTGPERKARGFLILPDSDVEVEQEAAGSEELSTAEEPAEETPRTIGMEELDEPTRRLRAVYEVTRVATSSLEEKEVLARVLQVILEIFGAERGVVVFCSQEGGDLTPACIEYREQQAGNPDIVLSHTLLREVLGRRQAFLSEDWQSDVRLEASKSLRLDQVKSLMCSPLICKGELLGAIYVDTQQVWRSFSREDLVLLDNICDQVAVGLANARLYTRTREEVSRLRRRIREEHRLVGESIEVRKVLTRVRKVARASSTVLLTGETGTGKELVARGIHEEGERRTRPFVAVDCVAISENLLESELFGHEKGAFTGADRARSGRFEQAQGGTLFLDEIGNMGMTTQMKLLRVLEDRTFTRVGGMKLIHANVRVIAATNTDLEQAVRDGSFREDLYYRLAVVPIHLPALRERRDDIPLLVDHFLRRFCRQLDRSLMRVREDALECLKGYEWPGNVRELRNVIERMVVMLDADTIGVEELPPPLRGGTPPQEKGRIGELDLDRALVEVISEVEKECIEQAMTRAGGKKIEAARLLGISRPTLDKKLRDYGISPGAPGHPEPE